MQCPNSNIKNTLLNDSSDFLGNQGGNPGIFFGLMIEILWYSELYLVLRLVRGDVVGTSNIPLVINSSLALGPTHKH